MHYKTVKKSFMQEFVLSVLRFFDHFINSQKAEILSAGVYFFGVKENHTCVNRDTLIS